MGLIGSKCSSHRSIPLRFFFWDKHTTVEEQECTRDDGGSHQLDKMETLVGAPQRHCVGYSSVQIEDFKKRLCYWKE